MKSTVPVRPRRAKRGPPPHDIPTDLTRACRAGQQIEVIYAEIDVYRPGAAREAELRRLVPLIREALSTPAAFRWEGFHALTMVELFLSFWDPLPANLVDLTAERARRRR